MNLCRTFERSGQLSLNDLIPFGTKINNAVANMIKIAIRIN